MNFKDFYKETASERIHKDLFKTTTEYQYYLFGVALGLFTIYDMANELKNRSLTSEELMEAIKYSVERSGKEASIYFDKMLKELEEKTL